MAADKPHFSHIAAPEPLPPPLAGVTVLDLTRLLPGPMATMHLADLGADVIKIEDTGSGDYLRSMGPLPAAGEDSFFFRVVNRNKRSLRLDLKSAAGVEAFLRLASHADVIVESFRPSVVDKLGIGYAVVRELNPRIVYAAITGYGQDGPWRQRAGHDINYLAISGVLDQIGCRAGAPALPNIQIGDLLGGALTPLVGVLAALLGARTSGAGRYIDVAMTDALLAHAVFPLLSVLAAGTVTARGEDLLSGGVPCYAVYATADDRHLAVGALEPKFWELFCRTLDRPELAPHGLDSGEDSLRVQAELAAIIGAKPLAHWADLFADVDCCVTPVLRLEETLRQEQIVARQMPIDVDGICQFAPPWKISGHNYATPRPAARVGADSDEILSAAGYSNDEIAALRAASVI